MRIYFVRHGESEANIQQIISNRSYQHGLTDKGRAQAAALADHLKGVRITRIFSSPLMRAVQTAEILAGGSGLSITMEDGLREFDCGVIEGKSDPESWYSLRQVWEGWMQHQQWESRIEGGENHFDVRQRFLPFIDSLLKQFRHTDEVAVLVSHGGTLRAMLPLVLDSIDFAYAYSHPLHNTDYVLAEVNGDSMTCLHWGGIA